MELLRSKKLTLPTVYFITDREEVKDVPIGIPFIYGDSKVKNSMIRLLEYEILYKAAVDSGFPFDFHKILQENGYKRLTKFGVSNPTYIDFSTSETIKDGYKLSEADKVVTGSGMFDSYITDASAYVDIEVLKELNVFPTWLAKIEDAIHTNIHNFAVYNPNMYNKKLDGMYGSIELKPPSKNLIIIDISGSIPRAVSSTCLTLAKNLSETFYADLLITGSKSTLYEYEKISELNVDTIYEENGMDNDQMYFRKLVEGVERSYSTAIVFGDNDHPGRSWSNSFNKRSTSISDKSGQELCKWKVDKLISFHTRGTYYLAGYARWFKPETTERIKGWVKYLKN